MNTYAAPSDLQAWLGLSQPPTNATSLLRTASAMVALACNRDIYTDVPTTTDVAVLNDATCAQAAAWVALGIDPEAAGLDTAPVKNTKIGTADVSYDTTGQAAQRETAATQLAPEARAILISAGLFALDLPYWPDPTDPLPDYGLPRTRIGVRPWSLEEWFNQ